ncbi:hypothetical protein J2X36_002353 [Methylobacterium sp. BE186]|uniref:hypothetical protein n=1 Tax=Methylobacterium sp. BE186 TaxID=2817715 RepID=UPI002866E7C4|nr:hypothetical protein [Methylobacterium sp. BE186]MDR7037606.1 hypothetical protein [Methylobacterium sp. BE186]
MTLLVVAQTDGRPIREVFVTVGDALARALELSDARCAVQIREPDGRHYVPEEFARKWQVSWASSRSARGDKPPRNSGPAPALARGAALGVPGLSIRTPFYAPGVQSIFGR